MSRRDAFALRVLATGLLSAAMFEGPPLSWAAWIALAPGYFDAWEARGRGAFIRAALAHGAALGAGFGWGALILGRYVAVPLGLRLGIGLTCMAAGTFIFCVSSAAGRGLGAGRWFTAAAAAAGWTAAEYFASLPFNGVTVSLGSTQWSCTPLIQIASVAGAYGAGFLVAFGNAALAEAALRRRAAPLALPAAVLSAVVLFGLWRLSTPQSEPGPVVALLQGGFIPKPGVSEEQRRAEVREAYLPLVESAGRGSALIVWPETTVPALSSEPEGASFPLAQEAARLGRRPQVFGASLPVSGQEGRRWNIGVWMSPEGEVKGVYRRVIAFPFGEYVPWPLSLVFRRPVAASLERGSGGQDLFDTPFGPAAVTMCGEAFLGAYSSARVRRGARLLINLSDGLWFAGTPLVPIAFSMSVLRAVETGRPLIRTDNLGPSAIIDGRGRILASLDYGRTGALSAPLPIEALPTWYLRWGDSFVGLCFLGLLAASALKFR